MFMIYSKTRLVTLTFAASYDLGSDLVSSGPVINPASIFSSTSVVSSVSIIISASVVSSVLSFFSPAT